MCNYYMFKKIKKMNLKLSITLFLFLFFTNQIVSQSKDSKIESSLLSKETQEQKIDRILSGPAPVPTSVTEELQAMSGKETAGTVGVSEEELTEYFDQGNAPAGATAEKVSQIETESEKKANEWLNKRNLSENEVSIEEQIKGFFDWKILGISLIIIVFFFFLLKKKKEREKFTITVKSQYFKLHNTFKMKIIKLNNSLTNLRSDIIIIISFITATIISVSLGFIYGETKYYLYQNGNRVDKNYPPYTYDEFYFNYLISLSSFIVIGGLTYIYLKTKSKNENSI